MRYLFIAAALTLFPVGANAGVIIGNGYVPDECDCAFPTADLIVPEVEYAQMYYVEPRPRYYAPERYYEPRRYYAPRRYYDVPRYAPHRYAVPPYYHRYRYE
jgi:hypothetical protein